MLWSCSFVGSPQPQTKLLPMAYAMSALPNLGAYAPLAHTAVSCLCVCCARFASTGLMFRPTGGWWIGFQNRWFTGGRWIGFSKSLDFWWMMLELLLWYCVCSRNCDILLVFPASWFLSKSVSLLTLVGCALPTICGLHVLWSSSVADLTWILIAHRFAVPFKRSTDFYFIAV